MIIDKMSIKLMFISDYQIKIFHLFLSIYILLLINYNIYTET